jgi:MATE family multidrug resistance protein
LANVVNFVVCALLVLGDRALTPLHLPPLGLPRLGALGAGISTSVATAFMAAIVLVASRRHRAPHARAPVATRTALRVGVPVGLQLLAEVGVFSLVAALAGRMGPAVLSAHQIALGLASLTFMGAIGVSGATSVRVGHAIGAGRSPRRAGLLGIALGMSVMLVGAITFATMPYALMRAFTSHADVIAIGAPLIGIAALFQLFDGVQAVAAGALRGAGDVRFPFVANVAAHWFIGLPIALVLGFRLHGGAIGLWWGLTAGLVSVSIALAARFLWLSRGTIARLR